MVSAGRHLPIDLDYAPSALISRIDRRMRYRLDARLEPFGITGVQFGVLARLGLRDGQFQGELQQAMGIEAATMTNIMHRLEREGWIHRACDPADRRRQQVWLTVKASQVLPQLTAEVEQHRAAVLQALSPEDLRVLARLLGRIEESLR